MKTGHDEEYQERESYNTTEKNHSLRGKTLGLWVFIIFTSAGAYLVSSGGHISYLLLLAAAGYLVGSSIKIAHEWERAVVLRLGRFRRLAGPGPFIVIPVIDHVAVWIDLRMKTTYFEAEKTLTRDNVPVNVDAVMFWMVWDPQKAALEVEDYNKAVTWSAQTALRDIIGKTELSEMLAGREHLDAELQKVIDERTEDWGIAVRSVELRDVVIPQDLQDVMSREAQAERERRARNILGMAEREIAQSFLEAADVYRKNEMALNLRGMNLLYESVKERGGLVVVPGGFTDNSFASMLGLSHYGRLPGVENSQVSEPSENNKDT